MDKKLPTATDEQPPGDSTLPSTADTARRKTVTCLAVGLGLAVAGILTPRRAHASYGSCWKCNCCGFEGSTYQCSNCGHQYADHGGQTC